jgi:hypothetical protein
MRDSAKKFTGFDEHPQLFHEFAFKARFKAFILLALAAGELPQPTEVIARPPLRDE